MSKKAHQPQKTSILKAGDNKTIFIAVLVLYALLVMWGIANHEQWRDEAQAWLIVRDVSFPELFKILRTEGHPPLWYLLIMPLAKSGMQYLTQNALTFLIMMGAVYILFFKTKLPLIIKLLLPFSYFFLFEYAFFARSYCMIAFFTISIISLYPQRFERPWLYALCIVGLFNTHVLLFTFAGMLALVYIWELYREKKYTDKHQAGASILMLIGGGYLLPYLFMAKMSDEFEKGIGDNLERIVQSIDNGLLIQQSELLAVLLLITAAVLLVRNPKSLAILLGGLVSVLYILGYKYSSASFRHQGIIFFIMLTAIAFAYYDNHSKGLNNVRHTANYSIWVLVAVCVLQLKPVYDSYRADNNRLFSGAKDAAAFLEENRLEYNTLVGHQAWAASALLPFMKKSVKMYYGECNRYGTYYIYDTCFINNRWQTSVERSMNSAYDNFKGNLDKVVFIFNLPVSPEGLQYLDMIYQTPEVPIRTDEGFYIYKFKDGVK